MKIEQKKLEITDVLISLKSKSPEGDNWSFTVLGTPQSQNEYETSVIFTSGNKPSWDVVQQETLVLKEKQNKEQYIYDRLNAYPSIVDQLDKIFHEGVDAWKAEIQEIKDRYPKP